MDDLPIPAVPGTTPLSDNPVPTASVGGLGQAQQSISGVSGKEKESGGFSRTELPIIDVGKEIDLPKEIASIGVSQKNAVVPIPPPVQNLGVQQAGNNVTLGDGSSVILPLTDEQIEEGLHKSIHDSWRWLAIWCMRKLRQMHIGIRMIRGKPTKVTER